MGIFDYMDSFVSFAQTETLIHMHRKSTAVLWSRSSRGHHMHVDVSRRACMRAHIQYIAHM